MNYESSQLSIFDLEPVEPVNNNPFAEIIARVENGLKQKGRPFGWVSRNVDTSEKARIFCPHGGHHNRSSCPHYEGFWLSGGIGSVQCALSKELLPGIIWNEVCKCNGGESCPLKGGK